MWVRQATHQLAGRLLGLVLEDRCGEHVQALGRVFRNDPSAKATRGVVVGTAETTATPVVVPGLLWPGQTAVESNVVRNLVDRCPCGRLRGEICNCCCW